MSWPWNPFPHSSSHMSQPIRGSSTPHDNENAFHPQLDGKVLHHTSLLPPSFNPQLVPSHSAHDSSFSLNSRLAPCLPPPPPPPPFLSHYQGPEMPVQYQNNIWPQNSFPNQATLHHSFSSPPGMLPPSALNCPFPVYSNELSTQPLINQEVVYHNLDSRTNALGNSMNSRAGRSNPRSLKEGARNGGNNSRDENRSTGIRNGSARDWELSRNVLSKLGKSLPGESPEDILQWVAERKQNWPSRQNVERKVAKDAHRERMGELPVQGRRENRLRRRSRSNSKNCPSATARSSLAPSKHSDVFATLAEQYESSCEEGEVINEESKKLPDANTQVENTRGNSDQKDKENPFVALDTSGPNTRKRKNYRSRKRAQRKRRRGEDKELGLAARQPSLLRKLLEKEIRSEHSLLLQAFRHLLVKDNL